MGIGSPLGNTIGIYIGSKLGTSEIFALKDNNALDYIDTGIVSSDTMDIEIHGRFTNLAKECSMGAFKLGEPSRFYFGISGGKWRFCFAAINTGISAIDADVNSHVFKIIDKKLYIDDTLIVDNSAESIVYSEATFFLHNINFFGSDLSADFECTYARVNSSVFQLNKNGYYTLNGVPYYNRGESTNLYPLTKVIL